LLHGLLLKNKKHDAPGDFPERVQNGGFSGKAGRPALMGPNGEGVRRGGVYAFGQNGGENFRGENRNLPGKRRAHAVPGHAKMTKSFFAALGQTGIMRYAMGKQRRLRCKQQADQKQAGKAARSGHGRNDTRRNTDVSAWKMETRGNRVNV
jgi:hypothetical protein